MNKPNNRRAQETNETIIRAAFVLLVEEKKPMSKITVREICEMAGINHSTFYTHYQDVYDLFEKVERHMADMANEMLFTPIGSDSWNFRAGMESMFSFILQYREFYSLYFSQYSHIGHIIQVMSQPYHRQIERLKSQDMGYGIPDEATYQYDIFTAGISALIHRWLKNGCRESPAQLFEVFERAFGPESLLHTWMAE